MSRFAVIGGGAAGLSAAYALSRAHDVTVFERETRLGGHAHTFMVPDGPDAGIALDMGFTVLNDRKYPTMHRLLAALGVDGIADSDMSFSYSSGRDDIHYAINSDAPVMPGRTKPALGELLGDAIRFWRTVGRDLTEGALADKTLAEYARFRGFSQNILDHYLAPFGACAWLLPAEAMNDFPAEMSIRFFEHHGMVAFATGPRWQYIQRGSHRWVQAFERAFPGRVERGVHSLVVQRDDTGVEIMRPNRPAERFDFLVLATHPDEALSALADPSDEERRLLGSFIYRPARVVLHTDPSVMPPDPSLWSSWNAVRENDEISATFYLNRLQKGDAMEKRYFVTLNRTAPIAAEHVLSEIVFTHPQYTLPSYAAQGGLRALSGACRTYYCGSWLGHSGHEDAMRSGVAVAESFGLSL